jgi:hypothetical protein
LNGKQVGQCSLSIQKSVKFLEIFVKIKIVKIFSKFLMIVCNQVGLNCSYQVGLNWKIALKVWKQLYVGWPSTKGQKVGFFNPKVGFGGNFEKKPLKHGTAGFFGHNRYFF